MILLSLINMTEILTKEKSISIMVEATFTRLSRSKNMITKIMNREVIRIEITGVLNLLLILEKNEGKSLSFAMANVALEADSIPALAVVTKASMAAKEKSQNPMLPAIFKPLNEMGVSVL